jgi:hypothetical protein
VYTLIKLRLRFCSTNQNKFLILTLDGWKAARWIQLQH